MIAKQPIEDLLKELQKLYDNPVDPIHRVPVTLLVGYKKGAIWVDADPIGRTKAVCYYARCLPVFAHFYQGAMLWHQGSSGMPTTFCIIKIAFLICLQPHGKFMEMVGHLMIAVEAFIKIDFIITIEIMQFYELVSAGHKYIFINNLDAQRLKQAGSNSLP